MSAALSIDSKADDLKTLIDGGESVNARTSDGSTALHWAARSDECCEADDRYRRIKILVAAGADIEAADEDGRTPLMHAALEGGPAQVKALLEAGANPNAQDETGRTPLMMAVDGWRSLEKVLLLLAFGANADIRDSEGKAAVDHAQSNYLTWKRIAQAEALAETPKVNVRHLLDQLPPQIRERLHPATVKSMEDWPLTLSNEACDRATRYAEAEAEAEAVLRALES